MRKSKAIHPDTNASLELSGERPSPIIMLPGWLLRRRPLTDFYAARLGAQATGSFYLSGDRELKFPRDTVYESGTSAITMDSEVVREAFSVGCWSCAGEW